MGRWTSHIIGSGLCFLIVFPPLAFGSVYPWATGIIEVVSFSLVLVWLIGVRLPLWEKQGRTWTLLLSFGLPLGLFLVLVLFQMMPMPPVVLKAISPKTHALYVETVDGYGNPVETGEPALHGSEAGELEGPHEESRTENTRNRDNEFRKGFRSWRPLSVYGDATKAEFLKTLAYVCAFLLVLVWVNDSMRLRRLLYLLVFLGSGIALMGMVQRFFGTDKIYGFWTPLFRKDGSFFGPFVNPNHFAGYLALVIPVSVTLLIRQIERIGWRPTWNRRDYLDNLNDRDILFAVLLCVFMAIMVSGIFVSLSRGGIFALAGSMVFLMTVLSFRGRWPRKLGLVIMAGLFVSLFVFWLGFLPFRSQMETMSRLLQDKSMQFRLDVWRDGWRMFTDFPLFGTGLGTFAHLYPKYKTVLSQATVMYPENDFLHVVIETGLVGSGLLVWFFVAFFRSLWVRWRDPDKWLDRINPKVMVGLVAAMVAVLIHGFGDFNLHIPATALHFVLVMALAVTVKARKDQAERAGVK